MRPFVNRTAEVSALRSRLAGRSSFVLLYGQRRTGKTWLLQHVLEGDRDCLFFTADETTPRMLLERFVVMAAVQSRLPGQVTPSAVGDWGTALTLLLQEAVLRKRRLVIALDECQYLLDREPSFPSVLQRLWDEFRPRLSLHIVLCGSALGTMGRLGESRQPLHGRFDLKVRLRPFSFAEAGMFAPSWSPVDKLRLYGIFGGLARHLAYVDPGIDLASNVCQTVLDPLSPLHDAPHDILRTERLSAPAEADAILGAMAHGENRFNAIAARTGLTAPRLDRVLSELQSLDIVRRQARLGDSDGSRYVRYRCADPFMQFWFRLVEGNRAALQSTPAARVYEARILPQLDTYMGNVFESIVEQAVRHGVLSEHMDPVDEVGSYWSRDGKTEVDLVVRSRRKMAFIECKWRAGTTVSSSALSQLREHAARTPFAPQEAIYCIASAGSFSKGLRQCASDGKVVLIGLPELTGPPHR